MFSVFQLTSLRTCMRWFITALKTWRRWRARIFKSFHECFLRSSSVIRWHLKRLARPHKFLTPTRKKRQRYFYSEMFFSTLHDTHKFRCAYFHPPNLVLLFICLLHVSLAFFAAKEDEWDHISSYLLMLERDKKVHFPCWHFLFGIRSVIEAHLCLIFH